MSRRPMVGRLGGAGRRRKVDDIQKFLAQAVPDLFLGKRLEAAHATPFVCVTQVLVEVGVQKQCLFVFAQRSS